MKRDVKKCKSAECRKTLFRRIEACKKYLREQMKEAEERERTGADSSDDDDDNNDDAAQRKNSREKDSAYRKTYKKSSNTKTQGEP